jgi:UDP-N-acetylmuramyl pentapeptide synthase
MKSLFKHLVVALLTLEARLLLKRHAPQIIAITGSVGKTTTKDAIYYALCGTHDIRRNEKSYNSELGVPLTILGLSNQWHSIPGWVGALAVGLKRALFQKEYPKWLVLEAGVDRPGDMRSLCAWLTPDVVVLTRFPDTPVHVESFASPNAVIAEKRNLVRALSPKGILVVNFDDPKTQREKPRDEQVKITFGLAQGADVRGRKVSPVYEGGAWWYVVRGRV